MPLMVSAVVVMISLSIFFITVNPSGGVGDESPLTEEILRSLLKAHSPVLSFDSGERVFPMAVEYFISSSWLMRADGSAPIVVKEAVNESDMSVYSAPFFFLDDQMGTQGDQGAITAYENRSGASEKILYGRAWETDDVIILQYWSFYVFNNGPINSHEGDWELIQIFLDRASMRPDRIMLSQHHSGEAAEWSDVECLGSHPVIYVALGSHAHYLTSERAGLWGDRADGGGPGLFPGDYTITFLDETSNWLEFAGRWGEWGGALGTVLGARGPEGPKFRGGGAMWDGLEWAENLPPCGS